MILQVSVQNSKSLDQYKMKTLLLLILYCLVVALAEKPRDTNQDEKNEDQQKNELNSDDPRGKKKSCLPPKMWYWTFPCDW